MSELVRRRDALWRRTSHGVVVLGTHADRPRAVNGPAASMWDLLASPVDEREAIERLAAEYEADASVVERDLAPVLASWLADGAIEEAP